MDGDYDWAAMLHLDESEMNAVQDVNPKQLPPTPPHSDDEQADLVISVSTAFYPGARHTPESPDIALVSNDSVIFYVHSSVLSKASMSRFRGLLPTTPIPSSSRTESLIVNVPERSTVLNFILHAVYNISSVQYSPSLDLLIEAANKLQLYGVPPRSHIVPGTPLFSQLSSYAPLSPLEVYTLAASLDLPDLAETASSHLLSYPLHTISDETAERIGAVHLKKLFFLHFGRMEVLKNLLKDHPRPHAPTETCDFVEQKKLARAWTLASAHLAWNSRPDTSLMTIESTLRPLSTYLACRDCKDAFEERVRWLLVQWAMVKRTI